MLSEAGFPHPTAAGDPPPPGPPHVEKFRYGENGGRKKVLDDVLGAGALEEVELNPYCRRLSALAETFQAINFLLWR
jgi:hypothetical protein